MSNYFQEYPKHVDLSFIFGFSFDFILLSVLVLLIRGFICTRHLLVSVFCVVFIKGQILL